MADLEKKKEEIFRKKTKNEWFGGGTYIDDIFFNWEYGEESLTKSFYRSSQHVSSYNEIYCWIF